MIDSYSLKGYILAVILILKISCVLSFVSLQQNFKFRIPSALFAKKESEDVGESNNNKKLGKSRFDRMMDDFVNKRFDSFRLTI